MSSDKEKYPLLGSPLQSYSPAQFREYVRSLYQKPETKESASAEGISIYVGKRIIIKNKREPKYVTLKEVAALAKEYEFESTEVLLELFKKRKHEVREK